jgi:glycosyltransferase involved in cell wall biosynthesis
LLVVPFVLMQALTLWRLLHRLRPDAIHAHWIVPQGLIVAVLRILEPRTPAFVITSHGADLFSLRTAALQRLKRWVVGKARAVTVVSESMREELHRIGADTSHVTVQPMGVDLSSRFTPDDAVPRQESEILFVGRLVEKKGLRDLLDAMPHVLARRPAARLTVVGFGPEDDERRAQATKLGLDGRVGFLGAVSQAELPSLYRRASVFVAPFVQARSGDREGLGLVMVEALGCGCPVVTTRIKAVREVFGGWPAYVADAGSPQSLAEQILRVLDDSDAARAWAGDMRTRVRARFDHRPVAAGYAQVLRDATDERAGTPGVPGA